MAAFSVPGELFYTAIRIFYCNNKLVDCNARCLRKVENQRLAFIFDDFPTGLIYDVPEVRGVDINGSLFGDQGIACQIKCLPVNMGRCRFDSSIITDILLHQIG